jgi:hypothetical protein
MLSFSKHWVIVLAGIVGSLLGLRVHAVQITYEQISSSGNHYEYSYSVFNDSGFEVEEFSIYFEAGFYQNLQVLASPTDWDALEVEPDFIFDGFVDWLALGDTLAPGATLGGFSLAFDWLGTAGSPFAGQFFEVLDPVSFVVLEDGFTRAFEPPTAVPEPGMLFLLLGGVFVLALARRRSAGSDQRTG